MPTVAFVSSKGGTGKTTAALLLALGLAKEGRRVAMIDCDVNLPLFSWKRMANTPIQVFPATNLEELRDILPLARSAAEFVIVDTEGSVRGRPFVKELMADLVLVPTGPSMLEAVESIRTSEFLRTVPGRREPFTPHACLLTRTPAALRPRSLSAVIALIKTKGISLLETAVIEKEAYRALFAMGATLESPELAQTGGLEGAKVNAAHYASAVSALFGPPAAARTPPQQQLVQNKPPKPEDIPPWSRRRQALDFGVDLENLSPKIAF